MVHLSTGYVELNQFKLSDDLLWRGGVDVIPKFLVIITIYSDLSMFNITSVEDVN